MNRVAALDIGTNTIRMLVSELTPEGKSRFIFEAGEITRLGAGMGESSFLQSKAIERSINSLEWMVLKARDLGVGKIKACATSALREALNRDAFLEAVREKLGLQVEVISGEQEASLVLQGVLLSLNPPEDEILIFDLGGGSTEFIFASKSMVVKLMSLRLGVVSLTERFLNVYPVPPGKIATMNKEIMETLKDLPSEMALEVDGAHRTPRVMIGTGGSATTLAGLDLNLEQYDAKKINGHILKLNRLRELFHVLLALSPEERQRLKMIERGREDIILAGAAIILGIVNTMRLDQIIISHSGLKEGIIAEFSSSR